MSEPWVSWSFMLQVATPSEGPHIDSMSSGEHGRRPCDVATVALQERAA